jgi:hypothetical protein
VRWQEAEQEMDRARDLCLRAQKIPEQPIQWFVVHVCQIGTSSIECIH